MLQNLPPIDFAQIIGFVAMALWIWSVSLKSDRQLNKVWVVSNSLWVLHWILMGGWIGAANNFVNVVRSVLYLIKDWRETRWRWHVMWGLIAAFTLSSVWFFQKWSDILPLLSSYSTCIAFFPFPGGIRGRIIMAIGFSGWLIYSLIHGSYGGIFSATAVIIISLTTIYRLHRDHKSGKTLES